jgi:energy-converting hydrogenase A subunit M
LQTYRPAPIPEIQGCRQIPIPKDENMRNDIFNIIANGISVDVFRRLARHLDFTKEEIKDIELRHNDFRTQNLVLLRMYETRRNSLTRLLKVLNLIEKPDLVREITEVLRTYSLDNNFNNLSI